MGVLAVTVVLGFAATGLKSEFSIRDILPRGGALLTDIDTLDAAVGGSTEMASVLVQAEATEARTLLNLRDLTTAGRWSNELDDVIEQVHACHEQEPGSA